MYKQLERMKKKFKYSPYFQFMLLFHIRACTLSLWKESFEVSQKHLSRQKEEKCKDQESRATLLDAPKNLDDLCDASAF